MHSSINEYHPMHPDAQTDSHASARICFELLEARCLCCTMSMRMYVTEREVTKYKIDFIIELLYYFFDYRISHSSIRTFIIAIFYYTDRCINRASYVISSNIYWSNQFFSFFFEYLFVFYFSSPSF